MQLDFLLRSISTIHEWTIGLKLQFLTLSARLDPDKVIGILKSDMFPLDESLEICKKYNVIQGTAFIQFRHGLFDEVMETYSNVKFRTN